MKVSMKTIADKAGVSISTVSKALNPDPSKINRIPEATRRKILDIAKTLNYQPNRSAEFLKKGKEPVISVIVPRDRESMTLDLITGIADKARDENFPIHLLMGRSEKSYRNFLSYSSDSKFCGLILYYSDTKNFNIKKEVELFHKKGGNIVIINPPDDIGDIPFVKIDDFEGGRMAASYLMECGCKSFYLYGSFGKRHAGYISELESGGIEVSQFSSILDNDVLKKIESDINKKKSPGIFAMNDKMAIEIMDNMKKHGFIPMHDFWVIGHDNSLLSKYSDPPIASIHQRLDEIGKAALELLINKLYCRKADSVIIRPVLIDDGK